MRCVREERTGWRDQDLSGRHRSWGWDCPAIDIDFLVVEYNYCIPIAIIEYKHENAMEIDPAHPSYRALKELADRASLPLFVVRYNLAENQFTPAALNSIARDVFPNNYVMREKEYVRFLYALRKIDDKIPDDFGHIRLAPEQLFAKRGAGQAAFRV
jgi:hypothetical protein